MTVTVLRTSKKSTPSAETPVPAAAAGEGGRPVIPPAPALVTPKRQPKRLLIAAGVLVMVIGALAAYWMSQRSAERVDVVAVARDVDWGKQISPGDLTRVQVIADPGLRPVPWTDAQSMVGKYAAVGLRAGSLLTADSVTDSRVPGEGEALVGVSVKAGQQPSSSLSTGDTVQLVTVPEQNSSTKPPGPVKATVYRVGRVVSGGFTPIDVVVPQRDAARLAADAAAGRIVIVLLPRG